jgi:beta-lactam-binding protein with PASTA domain
VIYGINEFDPWNTLTMLKKKIFKSALFALILLNLFFLSALLSFHITLKSEMVSIPDLKGKSLEEAENELTKRKLFIVQGGIQLHDQYEQGLIVSQDPPPNSRIKIFKEVKVTLSAGKEKVTVPRIIGRNIQQINQTLHDSGLRKGKISHIHTPKYAAGKQGEREKKYLMPDLLGKQIDSVLKQLRELDFRVEHVRHSYYPGLESGIIIKQFPPQGYRIQKRNLITLEVSK